MNVNIRLYIITGGRPCTWVLIPLHICDFHFNSKNWNSKKTELLLFYKTQSSSRFQILLNNEQRFQIDNVVLPKQNAVSLNILKHFSCLNNLFIMLVYDTWELLNSFQFICFCFELEMFTWYHVLFLLMRQSKMKIFLLNKKKTINIVLSSIDA